MGNYKSVIILSSFIFHAFVSLSFAQNAKEIAALKAQSFDQLLLKQEEYKEAAMKIWNYAELGYQESESSQLLQSLLKDNGFSVESGVAGIPTSFVASYGEGEPVIAILAEFDALPGFSQSTNSEREIVEGKEAGHACGHHLFGVGSAAAGIEIKDLIAKQLLKGTVKVIGTPAEEGGAGKVYLVREGVFEDPLS